MSASLKQKINTPSSSEAEIVVVDDFVTMISWITNFLQAQGYDILKNILYQKNQSATPLEQNGLKSFSNRSWHQNIIYIFVSDIIGRGELHVEHCHTSEMIVDFTMKPLQGKKFKELWIQVQYS